MVGTKLELTRQYEGFEDPTIAAFTQGFNDFAEYQAKLAPDSPEAQQLDNVMGLMLPFSTIAKKLHENEVPGGEEARYHDVVRALSEVDFYARNNPEMANVQLAEPVEAFLQAAATIVQDAVSAIHEVHEKAGVPFRRGAMTPNKW